MADLCLIVQGIRIHVGFYRDRAGWWPDPVDTYVVDDDGRLVSAVDQPGRLGEMDADGQFQSLICLALQAANDDVIAAWERDQRRQEAEAQRRRNDRDDRTDSPEELEK
ncbi:MAG TPA: hypothetical protein VF920_07910 [Dongiaceae bacterium]